MYFGLTCDAGHPLKNSIKAKLWFWIVRIRYPGGQQPKTVDHVSERVSVFKFIFTYGQEDKAHFAYGHLERDGAVAYEQEGEIEPKW